MSNHLLVVGGGIAGLSAAVYAVKRGWQVTLLESSPHLGGRARSFKSEEPDCVLDNGQHVLASNYVETRAFMEELGSEGKVVFESQLSVNFLLNSRRSLIFRTMNLPAPFHFLLPLLIHFPLTYRDRRDLLRWGNTVRNLRERQLKSMTIREWLSISSHPEILIDLLWQPLALATLNTDVYRGSAFLLSEVLEKAFLADAGRAGLAIPDVGLSELFANPAVDYLQNYGSQALCTTPVKSIELTSEKSLNAVMRNSEAQSFDAAVMAVPPYVCAQLLKKIAGFEEQVERWNQFTYSPIITINFWLKQPLTGELPIAFVDSPIHWIFSMQATHAGPTQHAYTAVISAADKLVDMKAGEFESILIREIRTTPGNDEAIIEAARVIKEKRATIIQTPESLKLRPNTRTHLPNLMLAGDWTDTGLPATIESAVLSGRLAVEALDGLLKT